MAMIELSQSEMAAAAPAPKFSAPFAAPDLRWARKKRLRCFNLEAFRSLHGGSSSKCASSSPSSEMPSPSPPSPSRILLPQSSFRGGELDPGDGGVEVMDPVANPSDPSPMAAAEIADRKGEERERSSLAGEITGRSLRSRTRVGEDTGKIRKKVELWIPLSKHEIDEDFFRMMRSKPPRRCKRRGKSSSDQLSGIFPGSWLPNIVTVERYKVSDPSHPRKGC